SVKDKLYFGGGIGLQFGTLTIIDLKPLIGYRITPKFNVGMQFTYSYIQNNTTQFSTDVYGGSIFTEYYIYEGIFAHAEIEALNMEYYDSNWELQRKWFDNYLVGGGYFQKMGQRGGVYFMILWNLNQNELSPYSNPLLTIGFTF
ncbi:MAG: hypothetical protein JXA16_00730, partial [Bacteroidales bacterium]|nr:hypothetical protein [Bacteroidales bacterium]